jgi:hypothetical protein
MELEERAPRPKSMNFARVLTPAWAALAYGFFLACGPLACSGTEVPDPEDSVSGEVQGIDGGPAVAARVIALGGPDARRAADDNSGTVSSETQYTDEHGHFAFSKNLAPGRYDFWFEDSALQEKRPLQRLAGATTGFGRLILRPVRLRPPTLLVISVQDQDTHEAIDSAECWVDPTPYPHVKTGNQGITHFSLPPGSYDVSCFAPWSTRKESIVVPPDTGDMQMVVYLTPNGENPDPLPAPTGFAGSYDGNSGVVDLSWTPVADIRLPRYGIGRQDQSEGGAPKIFFTDTTFYRDVPFDKTDSVQFKNLQYSVYSEKRVAGGDPGSSRRTYLTLNAPRPWAYGPRIDTLAPLESLTAYHVGDTVRIAAAWTNRIRENDSLIWRVTGQAGLAQARAHPAAIGKDTLAFVLPDTGNYQVNLIIRDAEGYRSWLALPLRF